MGINSVNNNDLRNKKNQDRSNLVSNYMPTSVKQEMYDLVGNSVKQIKVTDNYREIGLNVGQYVENLFPPITNETVADRAYSREALLGLYASNEQTSKDTLNSIRDKWIIVDDDVSIENNSALSPEILLEVGQTYCVYLTGSKEKYLIHILTKNANNNNVTTIYRQFWPGLNLPDLYNTFFKASTPSTPTIPEVCLGMSENNKYYKCRFQVDGAINHITKTVNGDIKSRSRTFAAPPITLALYKCNEQDKIYRVIDQDNRIIQICYNEEQQQEDSVEIK